jgi:hypothetical protein
MITKTETAKTTTLDTKFLERLVELEVQDISPETARKLLQFQFETAQHERVSSLSEKAQQGTLTRDEQDELDEYIRVGTRLAILQSRARQALRNVEQAS